NKVLLVRSGGDGDFQNGGIRVAPTANWPLASDFSNDDTTLLFRIDPAELPLPPDYYRFTMIGGGNLPTPNPVETNIDVSVSNPAPTPPGGTPLAQYQGGASIDLNPLHPDNLVVASNNKAGAVVTAYLSTDGGLTWDDRPLT